MARGSDSGQNDTVSTPPSASAPRVLLVLGHGRDESLCHHLTRVAHAELERLGAECRRHDLLADGFDPALPLGSDQRHATEVSAQEEPLVARYQQDVCWADVYVIVHPVWWFAPPALLKGWVDRVLADGVALTHSSEPPVGSLGGRKALVVQTFNAPRVAERLLMRRISARFWTNVVFPSVGIRDVKPLALYEVGSLSDRRRERFERRLRRSIARLVAGRPRSAGA